MRRPQLLAACLCLLGCKQENPYSEKAEPTAAAKGPPPKLVGIDPDKFDCQAFLPAADVSQAVGVQVTFEDVGQPAAPGTPRACTYVFHYKPTKEEIEAEEKAAEKRIKRQEAGGKTTIDDAVAAWGKSKDKTYGIAFDCRDKAHENTVQWMATLVDKQPLKDVQLGKKAMDHSNAQLVFLDDKTPCAVTVTAADEAIRLALGQLVHGRLKPENAPMRPRAAAQ